jgi:hypothetical protein
MTRAEFVEAIEEGGVTAMDVPARDLGIYDAYADAFRIIYNNLDAACGARTSPARGAR